MTSVVITGAGLVTCFADDPASLQLALCEGGRRPGHVTTFGTDGLACNRGDAVDPALLRGALGYGPLVGVDKIGQLAIVGVSRALRAARLAPEASADLGLVVGTMFSGAHTISAFDRRAQTAGPGLASPLDFANTVLNAAAGQTAIRLSLRGVNATIASGQTSGLQAIAYASTLIASNSAPALIAGGVEELAFESYLGFCRAGLMCGTNGRPGHVPVPFDVARSGCALAEAAAFVALEPAAAASARGARIAASVAGIGGCFDPGALSRGHCDAGAIAEAIRIALNQANVDPDEVEAVSAGANGSAADQHEGDALLDVFGASPRPPAVAAIKAVAGETLGASGPMQIIAMCEAMAEGRLPGVRGLQAVGDTRLAGWISAETRSLPIHTSLVISASSDGDCCAVVLRDGRDA